MNKVSKKNLQRGFIKLTKKSLITTLIALVVFFGTGLYMLFGPNVKTAEAAWFNDNWGFRKAVTLTVTSSASDITNLQTLLTVDTTGITANLQTNCEDLRFTSVSGKILPYYAPSCSDNSATNKVWVQADLVPKNTTTYTLYMYYGNPSASAGSDSNTFNLFNGLVGYWAMNESSGDLSDSSVNTNTATATGTSVVAGKFANSRSFNGTTDYTNIADNSTLYSSTETIGGWFKRSSGSVGAIVVDKRTITDEFAISVSSGLVPVASVYPSTGTPTVLTSSTAVVADTWNHILLVINGTSVTLYLNGNQVATGSLDANLINGTSPLRFGNDVPRTFDPITLDDIRLYNRALSTAEVTQLYNDSTSSILTTVQPTTVPSTSFATEEKAPSPVAYWKFDDGTGTTAQDATTNNADGTLAGTTVPTWQTEDQCIAGKCLYFDGSTSKVTVATAVTGVQTVSMWVKPNTLTSTLIDLDGGTHKITVNSSGVITATGFTSPTSYVNGISGGTLTVNTWNYVTVTTGTSFSTTSSLTMATDGTTLLKGFIDEVRIYNKALTQAEVNANYNSRSNPEGLSSQVSQLPNNQPGALSNGLVGYWKLDESSGNMTDSSGNGNTGTVNGTTVATGKYGNGRLFNGSSDYVSVNSSAYNFASGDFTASVWANPSALDASYDGLMTVECATCDNSWRIVRDTGNSFFSTTYGTSSTFNFSAVSTGAWHMYTITKSGTTLRLFLDGSLVSANTVNATHAGASTQIWFGTYRTTAGHYFNGYMDEIRAYNRALSPAEVTQLYNFAPGPKVNLKMEEGSGTTTNDSSGNANTGTINSGTWTTGKYGKGISVNGTSGSDVSVPDFAY